MLQVVGSDPGGAWLGCKRFCGRKRHVHYFCSRCRIFRAHLSWIRNLCLFLFIWISVQFWTSETYLVFLCMLCFCRFALPALRRPSRSSRARPRHCCLQLYLGAEPEGLDPYCYCMFYYYYYYYYYYIRPMGVYGSPMNGTWENDEIWHTHRYGHK